MSCYLQGWKIADGKKLQNVFFMVVTGSNCQVLTLIFREESLEKAEL